MCFRGSSPSFYLVPVIVFARNFLIAMYYISYCKSFTNFLFSNVPPSDTK